MSVCCPTVDRDDRLFEVWRECVTDRGCVDTYLASRGLPPDVLVGVSTEVIRFHPSLPYYDSEGHRQGDFPAMVAKVTDGDGKIVTLHRTYLAPDGSGKLDLGDNAPSKKLMTPTTDGATRGASIKLAPAGSVIGIAEGIETALAVHAATGAPCWSAVSAGGLESVLLPTTVKTVHVWADNDASHRGYQAAEKLATRLCHEGRAIYVHLPNQVGKDWLDVYSEAGADPLLAETTEGQRWVSPTDAPSIDLGALLDRTATFLRRFVIFPLPEQVLTVALWVAHTYVFDRFDTSPYLAITSPEKRCGKSRVFELLDLLVRRPWRAVSPSAAVLYRKLEQHRPTLLLDESDAIFGAGGRQASEKNEELRAVLNAGNRRGTTVDRCAGANRDMLQSFDIFSPKAFAGIGAAIPDTVTDRAVVVRMARKAPGETVERFRVRKAEPGGYELRDLFAHWAPTAMLPEDPDLPDELDDRAQDSWEVLLAIADAAGGEWPEQARHAALVLSAGRTDTSGSLGVRLLSDTRSVFEATNADRISTADLLAGLAALEESPWATLQQGECMKPSKLAALLKPYGVTPAQHRFADKTAKGYLRGDFADAWNRYLQPLTPAYSGSETKQGKHPCKTQENEPKQTTGNSTDVSPQKATICRDVSGVSLCSENKDPEMTSDVQTDAEESQIEVLAWWRQEYGDSLCVVEL